MKYIKSCLKNLSGSETEKNLLQTFAGESRASNKYMLYAEKAIQEGYVYVAQIFQETSNNEKAHSRRIYNDFLKQINTTKDNLETAMKGEELESDELYKEFEETARKEGFDEIAEFYKELREGEENHKKRFASLRDRILSDTMFASPREEYWQCINCGYIHIGLEAPEVCPLCNYPKSYFKIECKDYNL